MPCSISINWVSFSSWNIVRMAVSKTKRSLTLEPFLRLYWSPDFFLFTEHTFCFFACLVDDWTFQRTYSLNAGLHCYLDSEPPPPGLFVSSFACLFGQWCGWHTSVASVSCTVCSSDVSPQWARRPLGVRVCSQGLSSLQPLCYAVCRVVSHQLLRSTNFQLIALLFAVIFWDIHCFTVCCH